MIEDLCDTHRIGKDDPIAATLEQGQVLVNIFFRRGRPQMIFNCNIVQNLLLYWIILNNIRVFKIEHDFF